jgi:hypothetical protein
MKLPIYEIFIIEQDETTDKLTNGVEIGVALVSNPAIKEQFIFFEDEKIQMIFNDEKMIVKGPAMIPNRLMYRNDNLGERYVYYSKETIYEFVEMLMNKKENKFNLSHTFNYTDLNIIESYFAKEPNEFGVPEGSWIVSAKVKDNDTWNKIKAGEVKGFSIQGLFGNELVEFSESFNKKQNGNMNELKQKLLSAINNILFDEKPVEETPVVEEHKVEEFEMVDSQEVATNVEEKIDEAEAVVESATDEALTIESVKALLEQLKASIVDEMNAKMNDVQTQVAEQMSKVNMKVEEFSNQPISQSVVEEVANPKTSKTSKASEYFRK